MKNTTQRMLLALSVSAVFVAGSAAAASWKDQLNSAATQLSQKNSSSAEPAQSNMSLSSLTALLNGGDKAVSSSTMTNAAGIMEYCVNNNVVKNNVSSVKDQMLSKLGLESSTEQAQQTDYQQGLMGLLNSGNGQQLDLKSLGNTPVAEKVKTKACDVVLKQGKSFIS